MAETANTAHMAELLCEELFGEFLWKRSGPANKDWACVKQEEHGVKTHPTDVVYYYDEPYAQRRSYVQCDLKSYAKGSITAGAVRGAIESLAKQVSCAEASEDWRDLYAHDHVSYAVTGLLVVYNHDGGYDSDFSKNLEGIVHERIDMPKDSKLVVLGPEEVFFLDNIRYDIRQLRGTSGPSKLPDAEYCRFFFPQLVSRANLQVETAKAATLEMLTSSWVIMEYKGPSANARKGMLVFYRRKGETSDEFMYLIDYLRQHANLDDETDIYVRAFSPDPRAAAHFSKAVQRYVEQMSDGDGNNDLAKHVEAIRFSSISQVRTNFSDVEIGMD